MKDIQNYKKRFYNLLESTVGDVKPLISEQTKDGNWYFSKAKELLDAMSGLDFTGDKENKVKEILNQVNTRDEWNELIRSYGTPKNQNLSQWLMDDLSDHNDFMTKFFKRIDGTTPTTQLTKTTTTPAAPSNPLVEKYLYWKNMFSNDAEKLFDYLFKKERTETPMEPYTRFANSCATKVSLALNGIGMSNKVNRAFTVTSGEAAGQPITTSASNLRDHLNRNWGKKPITINGSATEDEILNKIGTNKTGIMICSPCGFATCSGHAFVWSPSAGSKNQGGAADNTSYHIDNPNANMYFYEYNG